MKLRVLSFVLLGFSFLPLAFAQQKTLICPTGQPGALYGSCSTQVCAVPTKDTDLVLTDVGGKKTYERLSTVPPTGSLFQCGLQPVQWTTRAALGLIPAAPEPPKAAVTVVAANVLNWSAMPGAAGYRVYLGTAPGVYDTPVTITNTTYPLGSLVPGSYFFAVTWFDAAGDESPKSPEANYIVPETAKQTLSCTTPVVTGSKISLDCAWQ